jgi:hypothetical protein
MLRTLFLAAAVAASGSAAQAFAVFTDRAAWRAALPQADYIDVVREDFPRAIGSAETILFDSGIVSTMPGGPQWINDNSVSAPGQFLATLDSDGSDAAELVAWTFPAKVRGFAARWASAADAGGLTVTGNFDGGGSQTFDFTDALAPGDTSAFIGLVGGAEFRRIEFGTSGADSEYFGLDRLEFAQTPLPAGALLALTGVGAIAALRLRRG